MSKCLQPQRLNLHSVKSHPKTHKQSDWVWVRNYLHNVLVFLSALSPLGFIVNRTKNWWLPCQAENEWTCKQATSWISGLGMIRLACEAEFLSLTHLSFRRTKGAFHQFYTCSVQFTCHKRQACETVILRCEVWNQWELRPQKSSN